uniref:Uncharacterized protein n=1 Tax=Moniliophthora roreri TaxID=221103 RepID=A0A0W0G058_MONRR
MSVRGHLK